MKLLTYSPFNSSSYYLIRLSEDATEQAEPLLWGQVNDIAN